MCFDVPWKTDRLRLHQYCHDLTQYGSQSNLALNLEDVMTISHLFLSRYGCDRALQTESGKKHQYKFRLCLQAALCHTRAPNLMDDALCRPEAISNSARAMRKIIYDLSQRYNDMQIELLDQVSIMTRKQQAAFALEMLQVLFF